MSDENTPNSGDAGQTPDPLNNLKAEFSRKFDNLKSELAQSNQNLLAQLQASLAPKAAEAPKDDLEDIWYKDPKAAAARIKAEATREIEGRIAMNQQAQAKTQQTLNSLVRDFPELGDQDHPLTKKAVDIYTRMPEDEKASPSAYKAAVREAAMELEVKPMNKRSQEETYSMSGNGSYESGQTRKAGKKEDLDPRTIAFAKLVGVDTSDKAVMERLKANAQRKWTKYDK